LRLQSSRPGPQTPSIATTHRAAGAGTQLRPRPPWPAPRAHGFFAGDFGLNKDGRRWIRPRRRWSCSDWTTTARERRVCVQDLTPVE